MSSQPVLTIAVPIFNMERCLAHNLDTYCDERFAGRVEVLCLNNASEDSSREIIQNFVSRYPQIFQMVDRNSRGYGSSINSAIDIAKGQYFRIVDADDWVDTNELAKLVNTLTKCHADIVLTDYQIVNMQDGKATLVKASDKGAVYDQLSNSFDWPCRTLPSIHNTTYRTELLRSSDFHMQDNIFFVDEEYVILPYLSAETVIYYSFDIYRYQVANPAQSTSPQNRARYQEHREKILRRLINIYDKAKAEQSRASQDALRYCRLRVRNGIGDHFTTLLMYVENRREGRKLAAQWETYLRKYALEFWPEVRRKVRALKILNRLGVSLTQYELLKKWLLK